MRYILILLFLLVGFIATPATYYVSSTGNDANNGTTTGTPWQTLAKINATTFSPGDFILFNKGDTWYGSITVPNSGASLNVITFGAYGTGANPIITGFTTVASWTNLGSNIWESTSTVSTLDTVKMVTINGVNTAIGRTPNYETTGEKGYSAFQSSTYTSITSNTLSGTPNWTGADLIVKTANFRIERRKITSQSAGTLNWTTSTVRFPEAGFGFFIQNDVRTLDAQNEWFYDSSTKKIKIYSTTQPSNVKVASVDKLMIVQKSYITVDGIDFIGANTFGIWHNVADTPRKTNITIQNCTVNYCGMVGIVLVCDNLVVDNNSVSNCHSQAITGRSATNVTVKNNTILNVAVHAGMGIFGPSISCTYSTPVLIEYNKITNTGFNGIQFYSDNVIVRHNFIDTYCFNMDDGGGIYTFTGGTNVYRDSVAGYPPSQWVFTHTGNVEMNNVLVTKNIIINGVGSPEGTNKIFPAIAAGIYCDNKSRNVEISYNTIYKARKYGLYLNDCLYINIHDNTVFRTREPLAAKESSEFRFNYPLLRQFYANITLNNNIFVADTTNAYAMNIFQYYDPNNLSDTLSTIKKFGTANNNVYARPTGDNFTIIADQPTEWPANGEYKTLAQWKTFSRQDANSKKSPLAISDKNDIELYYNNTKANITVTFTTRMHDFQGNEIYNSKVLEPFTSTILINSHFVPVMMIGKPLKYGTKYIIHKRKLLFN